MTTLIILIAVLGLAGVSYGVFLWKKEEPEIVIIEEKPEINIPKFKEYEIKSEEENNTINEEELERKRELERVLNEKKQHRELIDTQNVLEEVKLETYIQDEEDEDEEFDMKLLQASKYEGLNSYEAEKEISDEPDEDEIEKRLKYHTEKFGETEIK